MNTINQILAPLKTGKNLLYIEGDIYDFRLDANCNMKYADALLALGMLKEFESVMLRYSLATGIHFNHEGLTSGEIRRVNDFIRNYSLHHSADVTPHEGFVHVVRKIFEVIKSPNRPLFDDGSSMNISFLFEYMEHLIPNMQPGYHEQHHLIALELIQMLSNSLDIRQSGTHVLLSGQGNLDQALKDSIFKIKVDYPDATAKSEFLSVAQALYTSASLEGNLDSGQIVSMTKNTPNKSLEGVFRASHYTKTPIKKKGLAEQREKDILEMSEGTLSPLNTDRLVNRLAGRNVSRPLEILDKLVQRLSNGDPQTPSNVLLVGAKSTGKTDLALRAAGLAKMPAFRLNSPKTQWVGETERKAKKMFDMLSYDFTPSIGIIDEIEMQFPMDRNRNFGDSGASESVAAILQETLADRSRNGKSLIIGTSNKPTMGASMFERFDLVIPVLMPLKEDFPDVVCSLAQSINPNYTHSSEDELIRQAANLFFQKHASPRSILASFKRAILLYSDELDANTVFWAAQQMRPQANHQTAVYCDLLAIQLSGEELLPWYGVENYPFPDHILEVMTGDQIDELKLDEKIKQLEPYAKV